MTPRPRRRPRRLWLAAGAGVVVLALVAWWAVATFTRTPEGPATEIVRATRGDHTTTVSLSGVLAPREQANVSFAVPGTVAEVLVRVGDRVEVGQPLARVNDRDLRNAVTLADANLAAARAQLQTVRDSSRATAAQVSAARAQVAAAQASADQARDRLADAALASPLSGVVAQVTLEVGDQVTGSGAALGTGGASLPSGLAGLGGLAGGTSAQAGATASGGRIVVVVPDTWQLDAQVGTADLPSLKPGQQAAVTPTGTSTHVAAEVDTVGIVATGSAGSAATFPVTLRILEASSALFSGSDADALVVTGTVPGVLTVPGSAITFGTPATVRRPDGTTVEVTPGRRFGDRVEIVAGLAEGDQVVVPKGIVVTPPPRPQFGPNGSFASPDPSSTPARR